MNGVKNLIFLGQFQPESLKDFAQVIVLLHLIEQMIQIVFGDGLYGDNTN